MGQTLYLKSVNGEQIRIKVKQDPNSVITGGTYITDGDSLGGQAIFAQKNGSILEFKGLVAGVGISLTPTATGVTITNTASGATGFVTTGEFTGFTASTETRFQGIEDDITYLSGQTDLKLDTSTYAAYTGLSQPILDSAVTGGTSLGGAAIFDSKVGRNLTFKGLVAGTNVTLVPSATGITINASGGGGGGDVTHAQLDPWTGATDTRITDNENDIIYLSGQTDTKLPTSIFNSYTGASAGVLNSALTGVTNLGTGEGIFAQVNGRNAELKSLVAGTNITLTPSSTGITINGSDLSGYVTHAELDPWTGATEADIAYISGQTDLKVNNSVYSAFTAATDARLDIIEPIYVTGGTNVGASGHGLYTGTTAHLNRFKNLVAGSNITLTPSATGITIAASGGGGGGAYLPLSGGTVTGNVNIINSSGARFLSVTGSTGSGISIDGLNSTFRDLSFLTNGVGRWTLRVGSTSESGSNVGSDFRIHNRNDAGSVLNTPILITRSTGRVNMEKGANIYGDIVSLSTTTTLDATHMGKIIECTGTFTVTLPNGMNTGEKVTIVNVSTGVITIAASTTLQSKYSNTKISTQYAAASAYNAGSNVWRLFGDITS